MSGCSGCLENIVMNEKLDSEHEDNLGIVKWHEDQVGSLNVLCFTFLISIFYEKILAVRLVYVYDFPVDSSEISHN